MRKLVLDADALKVQSFVTVTAGTEGGTVHAHTGGGALEFSCDPDTCAGGGAPTWPTCNQATCPKTGPCFGTCNGADTCNCEFTKVSCDPGGHTCYQTCGDTWCPYNPCM